MFFKNIRKKSFSDEEEESDLIINNDEFCTLNESKTIEQNLFKLNKNKIAKNLNSEQKNNLYQNNKILLKNPKFPKLTSDKINTPDNNKNNNTNFENHKNKINNNEEKTIFSKITEDLYLDSLNNIKPKKNMNDLNKIKDDNYNKLTVENYLFTCADKENSKNKKIINDFIERKNKEQICKKISINQKNNPKNEKEEKKYSSEHKKSKRMKGSRSPEQFLEDQKILETKHKNYIDKLIQIHNEEINLCLKDRPTISRQSERLANLNRNSNKNIHLKLYEEFNIRKKNIEEKNKNKNTFIISEYESGLNKKLDNGQIIENTKRLYKEYEKKKKAINENQIKQLNEIKNLSSYSLINKNSNDIILKQFITIYKNVLKILFNKTISDNFVFAFGDFLLFIYKLGLVNKDFNHEKIQKEKFKQILKNLNINENIIKRDNSEEFNTNTNINNTTNNNNPININTSTPNNLINKNINNINKTEIKKIKNNIKKLRNISPEEEKYRKNIVDFSYKVLKRNTFLKTKSTGKKTYNNTGNNSEKNIHENDRQFKLAKEAWKIITKNKIFDEELLVSSKIVLLFFLSLCGIYKGDINDNFIKKDFGFLLTDKNDLIDVETAKHIYKYFYIYRNSIMYNGIEKIKLKKKDSEIRNIELKKFERNSKSFIKKSYYTNFYKNNKDKGKDSINKRNKKVLNIAKNKTGYKSFYNIKNKLKLNSNSNTDKEKEKYNSSNIGNIINKKINYKKNIIKNKKKIKNLCTARYQNKLLKKIKKDININKNENIINEYTLKRNLKQMNQKHNSNSSFNSNSLFSQNVYEPQLNKNLDKSNNRGSGDGGHLKEKKSSISQYIFNEDYRIKDDIESNSNFNDNEINKEKNIIQKYNEIRNNNINTNNNKNNNIYEDNNISNNNVNESSLNEEVTQTNKNTNREKFGSALGTKKKKYIFKIKIRDEMIKLVINKGDDINFKINEFCLQNDLDEDDKEQIIEAVNLKLLRT